MADKPQGDEILGLGLDVAQFVKALQQAMEAYNVFSRQFTRSLSVRLDPQSMQGISTAFGTQLRQAMTLLKGSQREAVRESKKAAGEITQELSRFGGLGKKPFKEMAEAAKTAAVSTKKDLQDVARAADQAGDTMAESMTAGAKKAGQAVQSELRDTAKAAQQLNEAQIAQARGNFEKAQKLLGQLQSAAARRAERAGTTREALAARAELPSEPTALLDKNGVVALERYKSALRELRLEARRAELEMAAMGGSLARTEPLAESLGARFERLRGKLEALSGAARGRALSLFQAGQTRMLAEPGGAGFGTNTPGVIPKIGSLDDLYRTFSDDEGGATRVVRQRLIAIAELAVQHAQKEERAADAAARATEKNMAALSAEFKQRLTAERGATDATRKLAETRQRETAAAIRTANESFARTSAATKKLEDQFQRSLVQQSVREAPVEPRLVRKDGTRTLPVDRDPEAERRASADLVQAQKAATAAYEKRRLIVDNMNRAELSEVGKRAAAASARTNQLEKLFERAYMQAASGRGANLEPRLVRTPTEARGGGALPPGPPKVPTGTPQGPDPKRYRDANNEAEKLAKTHTGLGVSIAQQALNLSKWLFFYKAVHEITRLIQTSISSFVGAGIQYTRELETQQLALRAVLAEHAEITNAQGQQLHGLAALNALQGTAREQWSKIQAAAASVVGTTSDLMGLYTGILPFAAALGANLEQIQELTKGTAVAASLLDVSFQDARSALVSLLQGRALTRNRLVGALGFDKAEIERLKESGQLLQVVQQRLDSFLAASDEASGTIAAMTESFKDFTGIIASGFTKPLTDIFKDFVKGLTKANGEWALFIRTTAGFQVKPEVKAFLDFVSRAMTEALKPLREFGKELTQTTQQDLQSFVRAIQQVATWILQFIVAMTKGTIALAQFIAHNRTLIKWLAQLAGMYAIGNVFVNLGIHIGNASKKISDLITNFTQWLAVQRTARTQAASMEASMAGTTKAATGLGAAFRGLIGGLAFGALIAAVLGLAHAWAQVTQEAEAAKTRMDALARGDVQGVINAASEGLQSNRPSERVQAARDVGQVGVETSFKLQQALQGGRVMLRPISPIEVRDYARTLQVRLDEVTGQIPKVQKDATEFNKLLAESIDLKAKLAEPEALLEKIDNVLAQKKSIEQGLKDLSPGGINAVIDKMKFLSKDFDASKFRDKDGKLTNTDALAQEARQFFAGVEQRAALQRTLVEAFKAGAQPSVKIVPPPPEPVEPPRYRSRASDFVTQFEIGADVEQAKIERDRAMEKISDDEAIKRRQAVEKQLLEVRLFYWQEEEKHFEAHVAKLNQTRTKDEKSKAQEDEENTRRDIQTNLQRAKAEAEKAGYTQEGIDYERLRKGREALGDIIKEVASMQAKVYGTVEDEAVASFERTLKDIEDKIRAVKQANPDLAGTADSVVKAATDLRPGIARDARNRAQISSTGQALEAARQSEELLQQQLQNGTVSAELYIRRLNEVRQEQIALLAQQAAAFEDSAAQIQEGLAKRGANVTAEDLASANAQIATFLVRAKAARQTMEDLASQARKVLEAIQAWEAFSSAVSTFLSAADGLDDTGTNLEKIKDAIGGALGFMNKLVASAQAFTQMIDRFKLLWELIKNIRGGANGQGGINTGGAANLVTQGVNLFAPRRGAAAGAAPGGGAGGTVGQIAGIGAGIAVTSGLGSGGAAAAGGAAASSGAAAAIPYIGWGIAAAMLIGSALIARSAKKAKEAIDKSFKIISDSYQSGNKTLGQTLQALKAERDRVVFQYSKSKGGRKALKDALPDIDRQIEDFKKQAEDVQKNFGDALKRLRLGTGPFADFAKELMDLEKFIREYLDSFVKVTDDALKQVNEYVSLFFEQAQKRFAEEMLGFEAEALGAQERLFSLINEHDGLYKQLRDIGEERMDLEEAIQDEQERRAKNQDKLNKLVEKEAEIRKQIAAIIKKANEDELSIRRRGVLEAQLTIAQQKALEISQIRNQAQEEIDRLNKELAGLKDDVEDETKANDRRDRDFQRRARNLNEREEEIRKAIRLNEIRTAGAQAIVNLQGEIFGIAADEYDLAARQNDLAFRQAQIQLDKWRETASLVEAIKRGAEGFFFDPPPGFPQIRVQLGTIVIDNSDNSTNTFNDAGTVNGNRPRPPGTPSNGPAIPRGSENDDTGGGSTAASVGQANRLLGYGDVF